MKQLITFLSIASVAAGVGCSSRSETKALQKRISNLQFQVTQYRTENAAVCALALGVVKETEPIVKDAEKVYAAKRDKAMLHQVAMAKIALDGMEKRFSQVPSFDAH